LETKKYGFYTAMSLVVANMIGTGVFTSLGFQVLGISSGMAIVLLWLIGGVAALFGALSYSELGASMPRSGGEYYYLAKIYHPALGFLAGWVSFFVGFAAPIAAAAIAFGRYFAASIGVEGEGFWPSHSTEILAVSVIVILTAVHLLDKKFGAAFQNVMTSLKILMVLVLVIAGLFAGDVQEVSYAFDAALWNDVFSDSFAVSLFWVAYAYSGWNAAAYIAGEIENPQKNIPLALITGTAIVTALYVLLNFVFLQVIPIPEMMGQLEVGHIFAQKIWGIELGNIMGIIISGLLVSSISSMVITGPRVTMVIGEDHKFLSWFSHKNKHDIPHRALLIQSGIAIAYILTASFEQVVLYIGFTLNLFTLLAVAGVIWNRVKRPSLERPYKTFGYPVVPILFMLLGLWMLYYGLAEKPKESIAGLIATVSGLAVYFIGTRSKA